LKGLILRILNLKTYREEGVEEKELKKIKKVGFLSPARRRSCDGSSATAPELAYPPEKTTATAARILERGQSLSL